MSTSIAQNTQALSFDADSGLPSAIAHYRMKAALQHLRDSLDEAELAGTDPSDLEDGAADPEAVCDFFSLLFRELTESADSDPIRSQLNDFADQLATATHVLAHVLTNVAEIQAETGIGRARAEAWRKHRS